MECVAKCGFFGNPATFNLCSSCFRKYPNGVVPQQDVEANAQNVAANVAATVAHAVDRFRRAGPAAPPPTLEPIGGRAPYMVEGVSTGITVDTPYDIWSEGDYGSGAPPRTLLELDLMRLSATIREKERWWDKYTNAEIVAKWREEVKDQFTNEQFDFVLAGLAYYDSLRDGKMEVSGVDGVWQADGLIPADLQKQLLDGVAPMENVPEEEKDWHPGSNKQVLDLVHPSLFPLIYGVSRTVPAEQAKPSLRMMNGGEIAGFVPKDIYSRHDNSLSKKFAWLPSEFQVHKDGSVTIESYINNLHPFKYAHMYHTIGRIFERFVPLFNKVLTDFGSDRTPRLEVDPYNWYDESGKPNSEDEDYDDDAYEQYHENRQFKEIQIPADFPIPNPPANEIDLNGKRLQVIVKLANIILTPENPRYAGGSWHIEGMKNENIAASGIYYYKSENISESRLKFRQAVCEPDYEQSDNRGVQHFFGLENEESLNQELASVETKEGRCVCFPNFYQHQVQPFELVDKTKPGIRKILVFFLVNPSERVVSTATIPPQQKEWYLEEVKNKFPLTTLPKEIVSHIVDCMEFPLSLEKAKEYREQLMEERKAFVTQNSETVFAREFSLCEH